MTEIGFALKNDGEVLLCIEEEPREWGALGVALVRGRRLSLANDRGTLAKDLTILASLADKLSAQGRVSVVSANADGLAVINECRVFTA